MKKKPQTVSVSFVTDNVTWRNETRLMCVTFAGVKAMNLINILGLAAGALTTASFLPQVIKTWKTRSAKDLSLGMFSLFCTGVLLWLVYGAIVRDIPVIVANAMTLLFAATLLGFKLKFKD